jgi:hypothetical protein
MPAAVYAVIMRASLLRLLDDVVLYLLFGRFTASAARR